jgi:hypothetical protein
VNSPPGAESQTVPSATEKAMQADYEMYNREILKDLNGSYFLDSGIANVTSVARHVRGASASRVVLRSFSYQQRILNRRDDVSLRGWLRWQYYECPKFSRHQKKFDEENRAQKPSRLLRPAY